MSYKLKPGHQAGCGVLLEERGKGATAAPGAGQAMVVRCQKRGVPAQAAGTQQLLQRCALARCAQQRLPWPSAALPLFQCVGGRHGFHAAAVAGRQPQASSLGLDSGGAGGLGLGGGTGHGCRLGRTRRLGRACSGRLGTGSGCWLGGGCHRHLGRQVQLPVHTAGQGQALVWGAAGCAGDTGNRCRLHAPGPAAAGPAAGTAPGGSAAACMRAGSAAGAGAHCRWPSMTM